MDEFSRRGRQTGGRTFVVRNRRLKPGSRSTRACSATSPSTCASSRAARWPRVDRSPVVEAELDGGAAAEGRDDVELGPYLLCAAAHVAQPEAGRGVLDIEAAPVVAGPHDHDGAD